MQDRLRDPDRVVWILGSSLFIDVAWITFIEVPIGAPLWYFNELGFISGLIVISFKNRGLVVTSANVSFATI